MAMTLNCWSRTDVGLRRQLNEDSFLVDDGLGLFVVADGMGGHRGGEIASKMAVESMREQVQNSAKDQRRVSPRVALAEAYTLASNRIYDKSKQNNEEFAGMGTTLVSALYQHEVLYIANVGDSRCYLYSGGALWQLTEDHSLVNELLRSGQISDADVPKFVAKNVITRSVGFEREVQPDIIEKQVLPGEFYLLCSDGLSGLVSDQEITKSFNDLKENPARLVEKLVDLAKAGGGDDNITVVILTAK
jgi:PPM family protein phosphatase